MRGLQTAQCGSFGQSEQALAGGIDSRALPSGAAAVRTERTAEGQSRSGAKLAIVGSFGASALAIHAGVWDSPGRNAMRREGWTCGRAEK